ncbi:MAG: hypothetical protein ACPGRX_07855 [Bdellovibrionales bacterium]
MDQTQTDAQTTHTMLRPDSKGRVSIGKFMDDSISGFRAFKDDQDRIILEPYSEIPARELWLWRNKEALAQVLQGIEDSGNGRVVSRGSFAQYLDEDDDD